MTYPDGETVTNTYDNRMLLNTVIGNATYVSNKQYDTAGRLTSRSLGNGATQNFHYYDWNEQVNGVGQGGRLETLTTGALQNLAYQYDAVGNVKQIVNSLAGETSVYGYDELNRLTSWQLNQNPVENYSYDSAGNLDVKNGMDLNYDDANHVHAVTHIGLTQKYWYDDNGNQETRVYGADTYTQIYDAENRMVEVKKNGVTMAQFTYNGDGQKVKSVINGETVYLVNGYYEKKGSEITKYYFAGASRVAMRKYTVPQSMELEYTLGDHLGSTSIATDSNGAKVSEMRYSPWGEVRYHWIKPDLSTTPAYKLPVYTFTGQRSFMDDPSTIAVEGFSLLDYNARFYDPAIGRFTSADSIVPGGAQGLDRYAYANNSPVMYTDPTGHCSDPTDYACRQSSDNAGNQTLPPPLLEFENEEGAESFTEAEQSALNARAQDVANALAREKNSHCTHVQMENGQCHHVTSQEAFYGVYDGPVKVRRVNRDCNCAMQWMHDDPNDLYIAVYNDIPTQYILDNPRLFVHELGHAFLWFSSNNSPIPGNELNANGFYQMEGGYEYRLEDTPREFFADMFLGWVYGKWEVFWGTNDLTRDGEDKVRYMNKNMPLMINQAMGR